jgi:hypothetical protein
VNNRELEKRSNSERKRKVGKGKEKVSIILTRAPHYQDTTTTKWSAIPSS